MWAEEKDARAEKGCVGLTRGKRNDIAHKQWKIVIAEGDAWFHTTRKDKRALKHYKEKAAFLMPLTGQVLGDRRQKWHDEQMELQRLTDEGVRPVGEFQLSKTKHEQKSCEDRSKFGDAAGWRRALEREGHASQSSGSAASPQALPGIPSSARSSTDREGHASQEEPKARRFPTPEVTTRLSARAEPDEQQHSPPLVRINRLLWKTVTDKNFAFAKIGSSLSRYNIERRHALLDPDSPAVYSCISLKKRADSRTRAVQK